MPRLKKADIARLKNVKPPSISKAIKNGALVVDADGLIDTENPHNTDYLKNRTKKKNYNTVSCSPNGAEVRARRAAERDAKRQIVIDERRDLEAERIEQMGGDPLLSGADLGNFDPSQKIYEETRLKKIQADQKALEYAERLEVVIDIESLNKKFSAFADFLVNDLIYMPESIADTIWMRANAAALPVQEIETVLKERLADTIKKAKEAAGLLLPPRDGRKYVFFDPADGEAE